MKTRRRTAERTVPARSRLTTRLTFEKGSQAYLWRTNRDSGRPIRN